MIVADRYGSVADDGVSFTEKEYEYAREIGKPTLAFVHGSRGSIARDKTESDPQKREKLNQFTNKIRKRSPIGQFINPHELASLVIVSFVNLRDRAPAIGYIRANKAGDLKKYADLLEEKSALERELQSFHRKEILLNQHLQEEIEMQYKIWELQDSYNERRFSESSVNESSRRVTDSGFIKTTFAEVFQYCVVSISFSNDSAYKVIHDFIIENGHLQNRRNDVAISKLMVKEVLTKFYAWGLISIQYNRVTSDTYIQITPDGQKQYGLLLALSSTE